MKVPWDLVLLGDGPLRETLNSQLSSLNLNEHVHLPGFEPYDELPVYYALANAFVHASTTEQWGLVVNEAIASGLPVIVSNRCGCVPELVQGNGFTFDPTNEHELTARLLEMASLSDEERKRLGDNSHRIAAKVPWDLVALGDGPLRETLKSKLSTLNLNEHVHLPGFEPYDELPVYYALAKAFVHASTTEQWGLVVNEAIASGLPVIVSDRCGCVPELINGNGFTFDPTNEHELTARLLEMASLSDEERKRLGDNSYRIAANFAPERFGEGLERAASVATGIPQKRFGVMDRALLLVTASYAR